MYLSTDWKFPLLYLSTECNIPRHGNVSINGIKPISPDPGLCILCFFSVGCLGELFPLVADPVQPDFHQFITLQQFAQGGREGGATSTLNQPNSMIHRSVERLKLYQKSPLGSKSLHTEREAGRVCATSTLNQPNFSISLHLTQLFMCLLPVMHLKLLLEGMRETITRKGNCKKVELAAV